MQGAAPRLRERAPGSPVWMIGVVSFVVLLHVFALHADTITSRDGQLKVVGWGTSVGSLFAALLGAMSITSELRHGTIRPTFLATPKRARVIVAKVATSALAGVAIGLLAQALAAGIASAGLAERGLDLTLSAQDYVQLLAGGALAGGLWGAIGVGIGALIRSQVGAMIGLCVWLLLIETALIGNVASIGKYAPGAGAGALAGAIQTQSVTALLSPGLGGLLLAAYAAAAVAAGALTIASRDVS